MISSNALAHAPETHTRLADPTYEPEYAALAPAEAQASVGVETDLRSLVDANVLPSGTTIMTGEGAEQKVAQVLPDGRLYADRETYDRLLELSAALGLDGNPWSEWSAQLADGRVLLSVLRESHEGEPLRS